MINSFRISIYYHIPAPPPLSLNRFQLSLGTSPFQFTHWLFSTSPTFCNTLLVCEIIWKVQDYVVAAFQAAAIIWITTSSKQHAGLHVTKVMKHSNALQQRAHTKGNVPTPGITNGTLGSIALLPATQQAGLRTTTQNTPSAPQVFILAGQAKTLQRLKTRHGPYSKHWTQRVPLLQDCLCWWLGKEQGATHVDWTTYSREPQNNDRERK